MALEPRRKLLAGSLLRDFLGGLPIREANMGTVKHAFRVIDGSAFADEPSGTHWEAGAHLPREPASGASTHSVRSRAICLAIDLQLEDVIRFAERAQ